MPKYNLPNSRKINKFITISQAASILRVSSDTLRNWEKQGRLIPERTQGGARRYSSFELYELRKELFPKKSKKGLISVSKAAKQLRVSADTIRNWEDKGLIEAYRTRGGARRFSSSEILRVQKELGLEPLPPEPIHVPKPRHDIPKFSFNLAKVFTFFGFLIFLLTVSLLTLIYSQNIFDKKDQDKSSDILGEKAKDLENMLFGVISSVEILQKQVFDMQSEAGKQTIVYEISDKITDIKEGFIGKLTGQIADYDLFVADKIETDKLKLEEVSLFSGNSNPENSQGLSGDFYFRRDGTSGNSALYYKTSGGWISTDSQSLQSVYEAGSDLTSLDNKNITLNLADTAMDSSLVVNLLGNDSNFILNDEVSDQTPFVITSAGNLGIGKSDPQTKLHLVENLSSTTPGGISIENNQNLSNIDLLRIISDVGGIDNVKTRFTSDGDLFLDGSITAQSTIINSGNADVAEDYNVLDNAQEGDVVVLTGGIDIMKSNFPYQKTILGVISEKPAIRLGSNPEDNLLNPKPVALSGRVFVKVSLENGPIERGDFLTSSSTLGVAMKAIKPGEVVGKALEEWKCKDPTSCQGKILAFVNVTYADPNDLLASLSLDDEGNLIIPKIKAGSLIVDDRLSKLDTGLLNLEDRSSVFYDLTGKIASLEERIVALEEKLEVVPRLRSGQESGKVEKEVGSATESEATTSSHLEDIAQLDLTPPDILLATESASLADVNMLSNGEIAGKLSAYEAEIKDSFKVLGETILGKTLVAGDLTIDGTFSVENGSIINSIPTLFIQKNSEANLVDFFDGKITLERDGTLRASSVIIAEFKVIANKISGSGKIAKGEKEVKIENKLINENSRILITPTSELDLVLAVIEKIENEGFIVSASNILETDASFDWWLIQEVSEETFTDN